MPGIGVALSLAEMYEGVEFPARPRLVFEDGKTSMSTEGEPRGD